MVTITVTESELRKRYLEPGAKTTEVAKSFGVSLSTLVKLLKEARIPLKGRGNRKGQRKIRLIK